MSGISSGDRNSMAEFGRIGHGTIPTSNRDASSSSGRWPNTKPCVVPTPSQRTQHAPYPSSLNPYTSRLKNNLHSDTFNTLSPASGASKTSNHSRQTIIENVGNTNKRRKMNHAPNMVSYNHPSRGTTSHHFNGNGVGSSRPGPSKLEAGASSATAIDLSDEEDIGTRVERRQKDSSSPDPIDSIGQPDGPAAQPTHDFDIEEVPFPKRRPPPDGQSTVRAQKKMQARQKQSDKYADRTKEDDPESDIQSASGFDEETPMVRRVTPGGKTQVPNVGELIHKFEGKGKGKAAPEIPNIDLKAKAIAPGVKQRMNSRFPPLQGEAHDSVMTSSSGFVSKKAQPKKGAAKAKDDIICPLSAWSLGCFLYGDDDSESPPWWLVLSQNELLLKQGGPEARTVYRFLVDREIDAMTYTWEVSASNQAPIVIALKTCSCPTSKVKKQGYKAGSKGDDGKLTFKFETRHANWQNGQAYMRLVNVLKSKIENKSESVLHGAASRAVWERMLNAHAAVQLTGTGTIRSADQERGNRDLTDKEDNEAGPSSTVRPPSEDNIEDPISALGPGPRTARRKKLALEYGRTTRQSARINARLSPSVDLDELVLVYPPAGIGAVNITRGDLNRLDEGQFLNDTLIEFGLKLWLNDLRESQPALADEVHVFSSFFYKKLNVKDKESGYQSVRKWTAKFDLFQKKYIIVPINEDFHWYLAIIYHPEHVLSPPPPPLPADVLEALKPVTRKRKRESEASENVSAAISRAPSMDTVPDSRPGSPALSEARSDSKAATLSDTAEQEDVAQMLMSSCSIGEEQASEVPLDELQYPSPAPEPTSESMEVDEPPLRDNGVSSSSDASGGTVETHFDMSVPMKESDSDVHVPLAAIEPGRFYGSPTSKGKSRAREPSPYPMTIPIDDEVGKEPTQAEETITSVVEPQQPQTYIFTFDSLGQQHKHVTNALSDYLRREAQDKKGLDIEKTSPARGKFASVPAQPNYCDCGLYLLHFAKTFLSNPVHYYNLIMAPKSKDLSRNRNKDWDHDGAKKLRTNLRMRTQELSRQWQEERANKERVNKDGPKKPDAATSSSSSAPPATSTKDDDSDSDIVIEDVVQADPKPKETPARVSARLHASKVLDPGVSKQGNAMRLR